MASSLPAPALVGVMAQIHDGVDAATWSAIESRIPELAALANQERSSPVDPSR
jgi:hypothetical protein